MFPLPADLPRNGVDHLMSPSLSSPLPETPDPVLDLLSPLFSSANTLAAKQARDVRIRLQEGVERNKVFHLVPGWTLRL